MRSFHWLGAGVLMLLLLMLLPAHAVIEQRFERPEPTLNLPQREDHLADALSPIHLYLRQNMVIRLVPPTSNMFSQRFRGLNPRQMPTQNR
jgi:hypothetical protein